MIYYMIKLNAKTTAYSPTGNKPIHVNNGENSQAIVSVDLSNAWLYYEKLGFNMVPFTLQLENGKKVVTNMPPWKNQSLTSAAIKQCHNAIAIITGEASQLMVIDIDKTDTTLREVLDEYGLDIDNYCCALSPSGGMHIYLNWSHSELWKQRYQRKTLTTTNRKIGIDTRADRGLIFAPPSTVIGGGNYEWIHYPVNRSDLVYDPDKLIPLMDAIFGYNPNPSPLAPDKKEIIDSDDIYYYHFYQYDDYEIAECSIKQLNGTKIDYINWIRMGFALKNKFGKDGLELWLLFADNSAYQDNTLELTTKWHTFPEFSSVNFATFIYLTDYYIRNNKLTKEDKNVV